ncbi:hypothetical protein CLW00_10244 [Mongoliibacter ruber]|uniref:Uncharacterized protein n=2 Tax=Mongoliibacter ruber TaxID=1750599 RepID=A0A2T0WS87_9BACT|nr:hypothetical protein CLW00_10244 [Mongoliibacter ruber]
MISKYTSVKPTKIFKNIFVSLDIKISGNINFLFVAKPSDLNPTKPECYEFVGGNCNQTLKAMKYLLAIALLMGTFSISSAINEEPKETLVSLKLVEDGKALFRYKTAPQSPILVNIYDSNNRIVKSQKLNKNNSFAKYYDFSSLGSGEYLVEVVEKGQVVKRIPVEYEKKEKPKPVAFSEFERVEGNKVKMRFNSLMPTDITVSAFENGKLIHEEKVSSTSGLERIYRLKGVSPMADLEIAIQSIDGHSNRYKIN